MKDSEIKSAKEINQELALYIAKKCFDNHIKDSQSSAKEAVDKYAKLISDVYKNAYSKLEELITD